MIGGCGATVNQNSPINQTSSCSDSLFNVTANSFVDYQSMGSSISMSRFAIGNGSSASVSTELTDTLTLSGIPQGGVNLEFVLNWGGTYSYSTLFGDQTVDTEQWIYVGAFNILSSDLTTALQPRDVTSGSGTLSKTAQGTYFAAADQTVNFSWTMLNELSASSTTQSLSDDFYDPASFSVFALDPNTGVQVSGVTVTGDDGHQYSVNPTSSVPEPATLLLLGIGAVSLRLCRSKT